MSRADYRVSVKVRNNNILAAAERMGLSIPQLAEKAGIQYGFLNDLINMTTSPFGRYGKVRWQVDALCITTGKSFDELFSEAQCVALETNRSEAEMNAEQVFSLMHGPEALASIEHDDGLLEAISGALGTLAPRERRVIELRYGMAGDEHSLQQVADMFEVTPERIRQIEMKAMRKLRHPTRSGVLAGFIDEDAAA